MRGAIPPLLQYAFMVWCSVIERHRENVNFNGIQTPVVRLSEQYR